MLDIDALRDKFPVTRSKVFLNHAAYSPLPQPVFDAMKQYNADLCRFEIDESTYSFGKESFANLIHCREDEIALVPNTSTGLNIIANVLTYPPGSNVVTTDLEYPSVVYPWLKKALGVNIRYVKNVDGQVSIDGFMEAVDDETVLIAVSHVEYVNGFKHDLRQLSEIAHNHDALLAVDAIQSLGVIPIDVQNEGVDFLTASCYKWLLGPAGAGYLYVRRDLVKDLDPPFIGWASVKPEVFDTIDFWEIRHLDLSETASRYEIGCPSFISYAGADVALRLLLDVGIPRIYAKILSLTKQLMDSLEDLGFSITTPRPSSHRSGIVHFLIDEAQKKAERLKRQGIIVSARSNGIRVAPHFYNTEEEVRRFVETLAKV
ncbi:MAG: aminotransferase class V-fold PLP-dependent enzyme [Candidatus Bathyarchaeota archaeon]|nr:MAG: aminotransferase class V-fold PLP-dependent enzyme [Candidatus Bathyarchaeota archaeon]